MKRVLHNNVLKFEGTDNECFSYILGHQSQSVDYAMKYEGWKIVDGASQAKEEDDLFKSHYYLLGTRKEDGVKVWLEDFSWDCDWYWGGGYLEVFKANRRDIDEHFHLDGLWSESNKNAFDAIKDYFETLTLTDDELWSFVDLMKSFYTFRSVAEIYHTGHSHYTSSGVPDLKNATEYEVINQEVIGKKIIPAVRDLLEEAQ